MGWVILIGYGLLACACIGAVLVLRAGYRWLRWRSGRLVARRRRTPVQQVGVVFLSGLAGFVIGAMWHVIDQPASLADAAPSGLGVGVLFLVVHAVLVLTDMRWPPDRAVRSAGRTTPSGETL